MHAHMQARVSFYSCMYVSGRIYFWTRTHLHDQKNSIDSARVRMSACIYVKECTCLNEGVHLFIRCIVYLDHSQPKLIPPQKPLSSHRPIVRPPPPSTAHGPTYPKRPTPTKPLSRCLFPSFGHNFFWGFLSVNNYKWFFMKYKASIN